MTTAAICATREVSWNLSFYRGEQCDSDLGLYYLRARYYNPQTGRFLSRDPKEFKTRMSTGDPVDSRKLHRYLYASGDPVNRIDPRGKEDMVEYADTETLATLAEFKARQELRYIVCVEGLMLLLNVGDMPFSAGYNTMQQIQRICAAGTGGSN